LGILKVSLTGRRFDPRREGRSQDILGKFFDRCASLSLVVVPSDYESDPGRWRAWESPLDVHDEVAAQLIGPVLDIGCGEGRLAASLEGRANWVGVDSSSLQLESNPYRPLVRAQMHTLPFGDETFAEVTHLWCLYHVAIPSLAITEAKRVLRPGGRYYASTASRNSDPELLPDGYPPSSFDAEDAIAIVASVFQDVEAEEWDGRFYPLETRDEVRAYCRHNFVSPNLAEEVEVPLWLTKRGVLVRAQKS
jgi:SAM-dependent methyltransferase